MKVGKHILLETYWWGCINLISVEDSGMLFGIHAHIIIVAPQIGKAGPSWPSCLFWNLFIFADTMFTPVVLLLFFRVSEG